MIHHLLTFFRDDINTYFKQKLSIDESTIEFLDGENSDPLDFKLGKITPLIVNLKEERTLRPPDRYFQLQSNGTKEAGNPFLPMHIFLLFVGRFKDYLEGMKRISVLLQYFQARPLFTSQSYPALAGSGIEKLHAELYSLSFQEQNELWGSLKVAYHPSLLYKISPIILQETNVSIGSEVSELQKDINQQ